MLRYRPYSVAAIPAVAASSANCAMAAPLSLAPRTEIEATAESGVLRRLAVAARAGSQYPAVKRLLMCRGVSISSTIAMA